MKISLVSLLLCSVLCLGCNSEPSVDAPALQVVDGPLIDLGTLGVDGSTMVNYKFSVRVNQDSVRIVAINSSCTCIVFDDEVLGKSFDKGDVFEVQGKLSFDGKVGENTSIMNIACRQNDTTDHPKFLIGLQYHVHAQPKVDVKQLRFDEVAGESCSSVCSLVIMREPSDPVLELDREASELGSLQLETKTAGIAEECPDSDEVRDYLTLTFRLPANSKDRPETVRIAAKGYSRPVDIPVKYFRKEILVAFPTRFFSHTKPNQTLAKSFVVECNSVNPDLADNPVIATSRSSQLVVESTTMVGKKSEISFTLETGNVLGRNEGVILIETNDKTARLEIPVVWINDDS